jgi:hypothetical protein
LAADDQQDQGRAGVRHEEVALPGAGVPDHGRQQGREHRHVRQQDADRLALAQRVVVVLVVAGRRDRLERGEQDQREAGEPTDVADAAGVVFAGQAEVGVADVGDREGRDARADQCEVAERTPVPALLREHVQHHGHDHHVAERVGQADGQRHHAVLAGLQQRRDHEDPGDQHQRGGDHQAVQDAAQPVGQVLRAARQHQQAGRGEQHHADVADVGHRRERGLVALERLEIDPGTLAESPAEHAEPDHRPAPAHPAGERPAADQAGDGRGEGAEAEPEVGDGLGEFRPTHLGTEHQGEQQDDRADEHA